jgi:hypothetical protein
VAERLHRDALLQNKWQLLVRAKCGAFVTWEVWKGGGQNVGRSSSSGRVELWFEIKCGAFVAGGNGWLKVNEQINAVLSQCGLSVLLGALHFVRLLLTNKTNFSLNSAKVVGLSDFVMFPGV